MPFRGRQWYGPLGKGIERNSGHSRGVSCGAHQSHAVKPSLIASDCIKFVQIGGIAFGCGK